MSVLDNNTNEKFFRMALEESSIPHTLYKYCSAERALQILNNHSVMFSSHHDFNDPFDCAIDIDGHNTFEEWKEYLQKHGFTDIKADILAHEILSDAAKASCIIRESYYKALSQMGILCLTVRNDNLLMWAHYSNNHQGVCLRFDISKDVSTFCFPKRVYYSDDYPRLNYLRSYLNNDINTHLAIWHKSRDWAYEEEYRVVMPNCTGLIPFQKKALTGIIFGCQCSKENKENIIKTIHEKSYPKVELLEARINTKQYKLDIVTQELIKKRK